MWRRIQVAFVVAAVPCSSWAQGTLYEFAGAAGDGFGLGPQAIDGAGDFNADGYEDVIIGAPVAGYVQVISGQNGLVLATLNGETPGDQFGYSVAPCGDTNVDGFDDVIVGAPGQPDPFFPIVSYAKIFGGPAGAELLQLDAAKAGDGFGRSVAGLGDYLGEPGAPMIAVAVGADRADKNGPEAGSAVLFDASTGDCLYIHDGSESNQLFGYSVAGPGDMDGDGSTDLIVASFRGERTVAYSGRTLAVTIEAAAASDPPIDPKSVAIEPLYTFAINSIVGTTTRSAGDVNNDGFADVIIGGTLGAGSSGSGAVVFSGRDGMPLHQIEGKPFDFFAGSSVCGAGDSDGDGFDDVLVGAFLTRNARVFNGRTGGRIFSYRSAMADVGVDDGFGFAVGRAGDVNADGIPDVLISSADDTTRVLSGASFFLVGDQLNGTIVPVADQDEATLRALAGERFKVGVMADPAVDLTMKVRNEEGDVIAEWNFKNMAAEQHRKVTFPQTGLYRITVSARNDTVGAYVIDTDKSTFPGKLSKSKGTAKAASADGVLALSLLALPGAELTAKVEPEAGFPTVPSGLLLEPLGAPIPIVTHSSIKDGAFFVSGAPLDFGFGQYSFQIYGGSSVDAEAKFKLVIQQPFGNAIRNIDQAPPFLPPPLD